MGDAGNDSVTIPCEKCGKNISSMNRLIHSIQCNGITNDKKMNYNNNKKIVVQKNDIDISSEEENVKVDNKSLEVSESHGKEEECPGKWECVHCTFLNEIDMNTVTDSMPYCSMCQNPQLVLNSRHDNFIQGSSSRRESNDNSRIFYSDDASESDESLCADLSTWTCSYCTIVNQSCDNFCQMCDMPDSSISSQDEDGRGVVQHLATHSLLQSLPAILGIGLTLGAFVTESSRGSSMRNSALGLVGSMAVGALAGVALSYFNEPEEHMQLRHPSQRDSNDIIARLPVHKYRRETYTKSYSSDDDSDKYVCRICLDEYEDGVDIKTLRCFHIFHATCIDKWLTRKASCPLCCIDI